ncbi:hypothetical protein RND81_11G131200 [Saponaria officinalis]
MKDDDPDRRPQPSEETTEVELAPGRTVIIGGGLDPTFRQDLISLLRENKYVFAYSAAEMPGIHPDVITHRLNVNPTF